MYIDFINSFGVFYSCYLILDLSKMVLVIIVIKYYILLSTNVRNDIRYILKMSNCPDTVNVTYREESGKKKKMSLENSIDV